MLSFETIASEFTEMIGTAAKGHLSPFGDELILRGELDGIRYHFAAELSEIDLTLTIGQFRERYLVPMAHNIRETIAEQRSPK